MARSDREDGCREPLRVLLVSGDMPSHVIAVAKLALWLADAGHDITFALPGKTATAMAAKEVAGSSVKVVQAGQSAVATQPNVHGSVQSGTWGAMLGALRRPVMTCVEDLEVQLGSIYEPLCSLIQELRPDVLVHNHATRSAAGDAAEKFGLPVVNFVHLPYDPAIFVGYESTWRYPKIIPFFPHVGAYPASADLSWRRRCWQWLDAQAARQSWARVSQRMQSLRQMRGLPPAPNDWASYCARHPSVVLGGPPFGPAAPVLPLTVVVGDVERDPPVLPAPLLAWLEASGPQGVIFISMGTGMTITPAEAREIARGLGRETATRGGPRLLWALRQKQQEELRDVLLEELGEPELVHTDSDLDKHPSMFFLGGSVRVEHFAPQYSLLMSGHVKLFLTHAGFGAFTEAVRSGIPMLCYPGGFDQEHNTARAIDAGCGVRAPVGLAGVGAVARRCLVDASLREAAARAQRQLKVSGGGGAAAVCAIERFTAMGREDAAALRPPRAAAAARDVPSAGKSGYPVFAGAALSLVSLVLVLTVTGIAAHFAPGEGGLS